MFRNCLQCNNEYIAKGYKIRNGEGQFCCRRCYHVYRSKISRKPCAICSKICKPGRICCSRKCSGIFRRSQVELNCETCKNVFTVHKYRAKIAKYCSLECDDKGRIKELVGKECPICKNLFYGKPAYINRKKYCSNSCRIRGKRQDKCKFIEMPKDLTYEQEQIMYGNLLGDGSLIFLKNKISNSRFEISQISERIEYINSIKEFLYPFSCNVTDDGYETRVYTIKSNVFTKYRFKWYQDPYQKKSQKIIPKDIKLTWLISAMWFCDDGTNNVLGRSCCLYTNGFLESDVKFLIEAIKRDLGVDSYLNFMKSSKKGKGYNSYDPNKKYPIIKIFGDDYEKFISGIKVFIPWDCYRYKTFSRPKIDKNNEETFAFLTNKGWATCGVKIKGKTWVKYFDSKQEAIEYKKQTLYSK